MKKLVTKEEVAEGLKKWAITGTKTRYIGCSYNTLDTFKNVEDYGTNFEREATVNGGCNELTIDGNLLIVERVKGVGGDYVEVFQRY